MENETFPVRDWQYEVANGDTRLGYAEWVARRLEESDAWNNGTDGEDSSNGGANTPW